MTLHPALDPVLSRPIAHRGLHDASRGTIENTQSAFAAALNGRYGIECDLQPSSDGIPMVFHDYTLDRLTEGKGRVDQIKAEALKAVPFLATQDRMQTLPELLSQVAGKSALVVEVKSRFDNNTTFTKAIADAVRNYTGPLALKSFDPSMIIALRKHGVRHPLGIVAMADYAYPDYDEVSDAGKRSLANLLHFAESRPDFLSWNHRDLPSAAPYLCRSQLNIPVMSWTIRSVSEAMRVRPFIDQIVFEGFAAE